MGRKPEYSGGAKCIEHPQQAEEGEEKIPKERMSRFITTRHLDQTTVHKAVFAELVLTDTLSTLSMSIRRGLLNKSCFVLTKEKAGRNVEGAGSWSWNSVPFMCETRVTDPALQKPGLQLHLAPQHLGAGGRRRSSRSSLALGNIEVGSRPEKHVGRWMGLPRY